MSNNEKAVVRRKCYECGNLMEGRRENYRYTECGLDSVTLVDVIVFHCKCGAIVPEIPAVARLHEAIAITLLRKDSLLSGEEIRFLRKMAEYSATKLAAVMGVTKEVMSRWENNKQNIGKESDRFLRFVCFDGIVRTVTEKLSDDESGQSRLLELAKRMVSLNLPDALQKIEDEMNGSKAIKVNPEMLAQFGSDCSLLSSSVEELVIQ